MSSKINAFGVKKIIIITLLTLLTSCWNIELPLLDKSNSISEITGKVKENKSFHPRFDNSYYDKLKENCKTKEGMDCCLRSVEIMKKNKAKLIWADGIDGCLDWYEMKNLNCKGSYVWCKK